MLFHLNVHKHGGFLKFLFWPSDPLLQGRHIHHPSPSFVLSSDHRLNPKSGGAHRDWVMWKYGKTMRNSSKLLNFCLSSAKLYVVQSGTCEININKLSYGNMEMTCNQCVQVNLCLDEMLQGWITFATFIQWRGLTLHSDERTGDPWNPCLSQLLVFTLQLTGDGLVVIQRLGTNTMERSQLVEMSTAPLVVSASCRRL